MNRRYEGSWSKIVKRENKNAVILSRYACVANDLPDWAKEILESKMGSINVYAKDSFEIYLLSLKGVVPKDNYILFCKKFAEIFEKRAYSILKKIKQNREQHEDFMVSNDYFWQEFSYLFKKQSTIRVRIQEWIFQRLEGCRLFMSKLSRALAFHGRRIKMIGLVNIAILFKNKTIKRGVRRSLDPNLIHEN